MTVTELVDRFGSAIPPEWMRLPLEPHEFEAFVGQQRQRMAEQARHRISLQADCSKAAWYSEVVG